MSLSHRLKLLINSKKISQAEFARMLDVTRGSVNQWLAGKLVPGHNPTMKIFEVFPDISADWLLLGRGEMAYDSNGSETGKAYLKQQVKDQSEIIKLYKQLNEEKDARLILLQKLTKESKTKKK